MDFKFIVDNLKYIVELLAVLGVVVEITPSTIIKVSPLKWIGQRLNGDVIKRIERLEKANDERYVKETRCAVLDFANSCRNGRRHTIEEFENILEVIAGYEEFCEKKHITNGKMEVQSEYIKELYKKLSLKGEFEEKRESGELLHY